MKKWIVLNSDKSDDILKVLLKNRGLTQKRDIEEFLNPSLTTLEYKKIGIDKKQLDHAVTRIRKAIKSRESVIVWTDYDVDGIASGAIVWETIHALGCKALPYVPHRVEDGYGLSKKGIDFVKKEYLASLIITVDHGITGAEKIAYAKSLGIETIVIDHHLLPKKLPYVSALVHTTALCATGIAWFFADYLIKKFAKTEVKNDNLDLVALATVADLVPLIGVNRTLVYYGLKKLNVTKRIGLRALITASKLQDVNLGVYEIGHILAPRINAMGRLTHALDALRLICTKDMERAKNLSHKLNLTNRDRQIQTEIATQMAKGLVRQELEKKLIFISHKSFQQGVIGLVAGRLADEFNKPTIVIAQGEDFSKASARSVKGVNIVEFIRKSRELLVDLGGHPMAAGFTVETQKIEILKKQLESFAQRNLEDKKFESVLVIDKEITLNKVDDDLYLLIQKLAPFGIGNSEPVFASRNVEVIKASQVGKDRQHLKLLVRFKVSGQGKSFESIGFGMGDILYRLQDTRNINIAYNVSRNVWNGRATLQLKLKDVKFPTT